MTESLPYDVVCAGPVTLDVTLAGLDDLPQPGEERFGEELVFSPGAFGTIAVGAARLGLRTALLAARPGDAAGRLIAEALEADGVAWLGEHAERSSVTVVFPLAGDRALASYDAGAAGDDATLSSLPARAAVVGAGDVAAVPPEARAYVMAGGLKPVEDVPPDRVHALFASEPEALAVTGAGGVPEAALALGEVAKTAIVTLGADGALAAEAGELHQVSPPGADAKDTTGAGDLFAAAYVWADLAGLSLGERLGWAALYSALSVETVGAVPSAPTLASVLETGERRGLSPPRL